MSDLQVCTVRRSLWQQTVYGKPGGSENRRVEVPEEDNRHAADLWLDPHSTRRSRSWRLTSMRYRSYYRTSPKAYPQAQRSAHEIGREPHQLLTYGSLSRSATASRCTVSSCSRSTGGADLPSGSRSPANARSRAILANSSGMRAPRMRSRSTFRLRSTPGMHAWMRSASTSAAQSGPALGPLRVVSARHAQVNESDRALQQLLCPRLRAPLQEPAADALGTLLADEPGGDGERTGAGGEVSGSRRSTSVSTRTVCLYDSEDAAPWEEMTQCEPHALL